MPHSLVSVLKYILCLDLTGFILATPILISGPVFYPLKYLVCTISWLVYLLILLYMLNLLLWTLFAKKLPMVQLLGSHLSIKLSLFMPWGHMVLLPGGSMGTPRLTIGMICVQSLLIRLNCSQYDKSVKLSTGLNYCQVVPLQVNKKYRMSPS